MKSLRSQLTAIEAKFKDGSYQRSDGQYPAGSDGVDFLLRKCLLWSDIVLERCVDYLACNQAGGKTDLMTYRKGVIPEPFKATYETLVRIRNDLEKLSLTGKWALREADLYDFQKELDRIDESRVNGNWVDEYGREAELYVQRVSGSVYDHPARLITRPRRYSTSSGGATATFIS